MSEPLEIHKYVAHRQLSGCRYELSDGSTCYASVLDPIHGDAQAIGEAFEKVRKISEDAEDLTENVASSGALVPVAGPNLPAPQMKAALAEQRALLVHKQAELRQAAAELEARVKAEMAEMEAALAPMVAMVKKLEEGIWTVNLYLGRDEEVVTLASGEPAPAETPIVMRQKVLFMDEETAAAAEDGGIDARNIDTFDEWLTEDPAHLDQVLPEVRGVVVLMPRRSRRDYGDPWVSARMDKENTRSYWLIRNGQNVYRMTTEFDVGARLVPARTEFTDLFVERRYNFETRDYDVINLEPGTAGWIKAEEAQGARERHFMRVALILQGLIDRTAVFHPLPAEQISLLHQEAYEAGYVRLLADDELELTTGRQPFYEWLAERNAQLRPGMRIIGAFDSQDFRHANYSEYDSDRRLSPRGASYPQSLTIHRLEGKRDDGLYFLYERTDQVWREMPVPGRPGYVRDTLTTPQRRASCIVYDSDKFILPVDLVTIEEMESYLGARTERHAYVDMFPLLKEAIRVKREEIEQERPFRTLLTGELIRTYGLEQAEADAAVSTLVDWWKLANRWHRPLNGEPEHEAKAVRMIVKEFGALRDFATPKPRDDVAASKIRELMPDAMVIARQRDGKYIGLAPQRHELGNAVPDNIYCREIVMTGARFQVTEREWVALNNRQKTWFQIYSTDTWNTWDKLARGSEHLTGPQIIELCEEAARRVPEDHNLMAVAYHRGHKHAITYLLPKGWSLNPEAKEDYENRSWSKDEPPVSQDPVDLRNRTADLHYYTTTLPCRLERGDVVFTDISASRRASEHYWPRAYRNPGMPMPWDDNNAVLIKRFDTVVHMAEQRWQEREQISRARRAFEERIHETEAALQEAYTERLESEAFDRFIEDYADPSLWEGHRKTLTIQAPHIGLRKVLAELIFTGVNPNGMTLREACERAGLPLRPDSFKLGWNVSAPKQSELDAYADMPLIYTAPQAIEGDEDLDLD